MARIAVRGGHNFSVPGARAIIDETTEDRKVKNAVVKYLKQLGQTVYDVTPGDGCNTINSDLSYGVNRANSIGVDLFVSIHFNKCYSHYNGALGTECWTYSKNIAEAVRIEKELSSCGFRSRGIKHSRSLYELRATRMDAIIVEVCFVEATNDVSIYRKLGPDYIGKKIAEAIVNKRVSGGSSSTSSKPAPAPSKPSSPKPAPKKELWEQCIVGDIVKRLQKEINKQFGAKLKVDGYFGEGTLSKCPLVKPGARGNITKIIQERLNKKGYSTNGIDGIFGAGTTKAVKALQKKHGLDQDGIVGRNTWIALMKL